MTTQKILIGAGVVSVLGYIGYRLYQNYKIDEHFHKNTAENEESSNLSGEFKNTIRKSYQRPTWTV